MAQEAHPKVNAIKIFIWLVVLTAIEIGLVYLNLPKALLATALILSAMMKAALVAVYFMHLKFEGKIIWGVLAGTCALAAIFTLGLFPDIVVGYWK